MIYLLGIKICDHIQKLHAVCAELSAMGIVIVNFENVDMIILGHLDELNAISGKDYKAELIKKAIAAQINIYSF